MGGLCLSFIAACAEPPPRDDPRTAVRELLTGLVDYRGDAVWDRLTSSDKEAILAQHRERAKAEGREPDSDPSAALRSYGLRALAPPESITLASRPGDRARVRVTTERGRSATFGVERGEDGRWRVALLAALEPAPEPLGPDRWLARADEAPPARAEGPQAPVAPPPTTEPPGRETPQVRETPQGREAPPERDSTKLRPERRSSPASDAPAAREAASEAEAPRVVPETESETEKELVEVTTSTTAPVPTEVGRLESAPLSASMERRVKTASTSTPSFAHVPRMRIEAVSPRQRPALLPSPKARTTTTTTVAED